MVRVLLWIRQAKGPWKLGLQLLQAIVDWGIGEERDWGIGVGGDWGIRVRGDWGIGVERDWGIGVQGDWGIKVGGDWGIGEGGANFNDYLPSQRKEFLKIGRNKNEKMDIKT